MSPVITAWSALSPFGAGREAFTAGLRAGATTAAALPADPWRVPVQRACLVPDFRFREMLGKKGTRSMDRATALAVAAVGRLFDEYEAGRLVATGEGAALVLGTTTGSAQSMMDFTRDSLVGERPFFVDPARFPNTVMNCAAGQCAIWYQLKGPNATVAGGRIAGLHALNYARRLLSSRRARTVLCGAVEEFSNARSWLAWHGAGRPDHGDPVLGEGCAILLVESAGQRPALAEVLAIELGVFTGRDVGPAMAACVRRALHRADVRADEVWAVSSCGAPGDAGHQERAAVSGVLGGHQVRRILPAELIGDTSGAAAAFQVAAVLATAERTPDRAGRVALVTAVDSEGVVGCALLRMC